MSAKRVRQPTSSQHVRPGNVAAAVMRAAEGNWVTEKMIETAFLARNLNNAIKKIGAYAVGDVRRYQLGIVESRSSNGHREYRLVNWREFDERGFNPNRLSNTDVHETASAEPVTAIVNIYDAKTQLSRLVERAAAGEAILIARAGKPMVRLVPVDPHEPRRPGLLKGLSVPDALFEPLPEDELARWE